MKKTLLEKNIISDANEVTKEDKEHGLKLWHIARSFMDETMNCLPIGNNAENIGNPYCYFLKGKEPGFASKYSLGASDTDIQLIIEVKIQIPKRKKVIAVKKTKKVKKGGKC